MTFTDERNGAENRHIRGRFFDADGMPIGPDFKVNSDVGGRQNHSAVATNRSNAFVVAWQDNRSGQYDVRARGILRSETEYIQEFTVNNDVIGQQRFPRVAVIPPT